MYKTIKLSVFLSRAVAVRSVLLLLCAFFINQASGQAPPDTIRNKTLKYLRQRASLDSVTAERVLAVNEQYKKDVAVIMATSGNDEKAKRTKINELIATQKLQLSKLVSPAQLAKLLPFSSPGQSKQSGPKISQNKFYRDLLKTDSVKAGQVEKVLVDYKSGLKQIGSLPPKEQRMKADALTAKKNQQLSLLLSPEQLSLLQPKTTITAPVGMSAAMLAIRDTFERKVKVVLAKKGVSAQEKRSEIVQLLKQRNAAMSQQTPQQTQPSQSHE